MKAITLWQPWATLVAIGAKKIETRSWSTRYRGELAIHASKNNYWINPNYRLNIYRDDFYGVTKLVPKEIQDNNYSFPLGSIVATCKLTHIDGPLREDAWKYFPWEERNFGDLSEGRYAWHLEDVIMLAEPIPAVGKQGLWEWIV